MNRLLRLKRPLRWDLAFAFVLALALALLPFAVVGGQSAAAAGGDPTIRLSTSPTSGEVGDTFTTVIYADNVPDPGLGSWQAKIVFDPAIVAIDSITFGTDLYSTGRSKLFELTNDSNAGEILLSQSTTGDANGPTGTLKLAVIVWRGVGAGVTQLALPSNVQRLVDVNAHQFTPLVLIESAITVTGGSATPTTAPTATPTTGPTATPTTGPTATPTATATPMPTLPPGTPLTFAISPAMQTVAVGDAVTVNVLVGGAADAVSFQFTLSYDPAVLQFVDASIGPFITSSGRPLVAAPPPAVGSGKVTFGAATGGSSPGATGSGVLATLTFRALKAGSSDLDLSDGVIVTGTGDQKTPASYANGAVAVGASTTQMVVGSASVHSGDLFDIPVTVSNARDMGSFQFRVSYDSAVVRVLGVSLGDFPGSTGRTIIPAGPTIGGGQVLFGAASTGSSPGPTGDGVLAVIHMQAMAAGVTNLVISDEIVQNTVGFEADVAGVDGKVQVTGAAMMMTAPDMTVGIGETFDVAIDIQGAVDMAAYQFTLSYDPALLEVVNVADGGFLSSTGRTFGGVTGPSYGAGSVTFGAYTTGATPAGPYCSGQVAVVTMRAKAQGVSALTLTDLKTTDTTGMARIPAARNGSVTIVPPSLRVEPNHTEVQVDNDFSVDIWIDHAADLAAFQFMLEYDPNIAEVTDVKLGPFLTSTGRTPGPVVDQRQPGKLTFGAVTLGSAPGGPTGSGVLATITFHALNVGVTKLDLTDGAASSVSSPDTKIVIEERIDGTVKVLPPPPDAMRFRGYTYLGDPGDTSHGLGDVELQLWAYDSCDSGSGALVAVQKSDAGGFYNFYVPVPVNYQRFVLKVVNPVDLVSVDPDSQTGVVLDDNTIEWCQPAVRVHWTDFFFSPPKVQYLWLPLVLNTAGN